MDQGTKEEALVQRAEDTMGIKIDVVKINTPTLDFDSFGREGLQEDTIWNSGYGEFGKVCFGKKTLRKGICKTVKVAEGWDELATIWKGLEFKEECGMKIPEYDRYPSLGVILSHLAAENILLWLSL